jgi:hypothetical protein
VRDGHLADVFDAHADEAGKVVFCHGASSMYANFAAGTLIVLGAVLAVLGLLLAASVGLVLIGLGSVAVGGFISLLERRFSR